MTLVQKFAALTPEQQGKFKEVKDAAALDAFLAENKLTLTDEEKTQAMEYFKSGKLPLADEELDNVAGGCGGPSMPPPPSKCKNCGGTQFKEEWFQTGMGGVPYQVCTNCGTLHN